MQPPEIEIDLLLIAVDKALDLALARRPEDGYQELVYGRERVEAALAAGEPWAPEMLQRWRTACVNFGFRWLAPQRKADPGPPPFSA